MSLVRLDAGLSRLTSDAPWELVASGFGFTEGPLWHEGALLFSDIPNERIYRLNDDGATVWREPSWHANGLTSDRAGALLACEHGNRRVSKQAPDDPIETLVDRYDGKRLNSPNDLIVRSDGRIFFTDPPYGIEEEERELPFNGVYTMDPETYALSLLRTDLERPNGLALSPDERTLYVADTQRLHVRAFEVADKGTLSGGNVFASTLEDGRPDGLKVDRSGRVYVCAGSLQVFDPDGTALGVIDCPEVPANCAWGDDGSTLYIAARTSVYRRRFETIGIAPHLAQT